MLGRIMESCNRRDEVKSREEVGRKKERRLCQRREKQRIRGRDKGEIEKIMLEGIISGSQGGVQEKASCSK